jgi:hypothetical protein
MERDRGREVCGWSILGAIHKDLLNFILLPSLIIRLY